MSKLQLSHYTSAFPSRNGDLILVNSFMGALCRVDGSCRELIEAGIRDGFESALPGDLSLLERNGYLVEASFPEVAVVSDVIETERDKNGFELIVLPHENCNFRCTYCYERFDRGQMEPWVVESLKRLVQRQAGTWGRVQISWFGGEPLLARRVISDLSRSFLQSCERAGVRYGSGMTTNGFLLTPDVASEMLACNVNRFQITLDGPPPAHDARRHLAGGAGTYARVMENLLAMHRRDESFTVRLRVNFDLESAPEIEDWVGELAPIFAGDERFHLAFHPIGRWGGPRDADLKACDEDHAWRLRCSLFETSVKHGFRADAYQGFLSSHGATCYAGRKSSVVVGADGRLYKCTVAFADDRNHVGWLAHDGALSYDMERWQRWVGTDHLDTQKCGDCWFSPSCQSRACPLAAMEAGEPPCPSGGEEMRRMVLVSAQESTQ